MQILFTHQNFPAQFGAFGGFLAQNGWDVTFFSTTNHILPPERCKLYTMKPHREPTQGVHRFAKPLEQAMINAQAFANTAIHARAEGLNPDVVVAHSGWGSGTFAKAVWPDTKYVSYAEWFYRWPPVDSIFPQDDQGIEDGRAKALAFNAPTLLDLVEADLVMCPTQFQAAQFPASIRDSIHVMHDGTDTEMYAPNPKAVPDFPNTEIPVGAEIVTYATRGMEPHRGFPQFMKALEILQKERPNLHAIVGGDDRIVYGPKLPQGQTWKDKVLAELDLDHSRIHWPGLLPRSDWVRLLQVSDVHVYLTVPFILSWSLIEAMAVGCALVASDTDPIKEAVTHDENAHLIDHQNPQNIADAMAELLEDRDRAKRLGQAARQQAIRQYSSQWIYPARAQLLVELAKSRNRF